MFKLASMLWSGAKSGTRAIATGNAQSQLGLQSPYLPGTIVRLGRFAYVTAAVWVSAVWYSGYVNERTAPGSGPTLVLPGTRTKIGGPNRPLPAAPWANLTGGAAGATTTPTAPGTPGGGGGTNPVPGALGGRLDQGFDVVLGNAGFLAPATSKILLAGTSSGWAPPGSSVPGGIIAGQILSGPKKGMVWYAAEGIRAIPAVKPGVTVAQGKQIGLPMNSPYGGFGSIEMGWANPKAPSQPLAQVSANPVATAWDFYNWIRSLGGPKASQTGNAGYP